MTDAVPPFPCTGCGACCRSVGAVLEAFARDPELFPPHTREGLAAFPYQARADGACEQLEGARCLVYADRPTICRVPAMAARSGEPLGQYYLRGAASCDALITADALPDTFRLPLPILMPGDFDLSPADYAEDHTQAPAPQELTLDDFSSRRAEYAPGSHGAYERGCTCPRVENAYGRGLDVSLTQRLWWVDRACPYHVPPAPAAQPGE